MTNGDVVWATENFGKVREREAYKVRATVREGERVKQVSLVGLSGWWPASIFEVMESKILEQLKDKAAEALGLGLEVSKVVLRAIGPVQARVADPIVDEEANLTQSEIDELEASQNELERALV